MARELVARGHRVGKERVRRLMQLHGIQARGKRKFVVTTDSEHSLHASRAAISYQRWLAVPYPTKRDVNAHEPKIAANLLLAEGKDSERASLLNCLVPALRNVKVLRSKDDFPGLIARETTEASTEGLQQGLI